MSGVSKLRLSALPESKQSAASSRSRSPLRIKKRKYSDGEDLEATKAVIVNSGKRKSTEKFRSLQSIEDKDLDLDQGINHTIAKLDNRLLADYIARRVKHFSPDLSLVEVEDRCIPDAAFHDTTSWKRPRDLQNMPSFFEHYSPRAGRSKAMSSASPKPGCPHTLVITSAGLRAADITRALRIFQTEDAVVAKLFAKHIKLREAIAYVKHTRMGIGVGTPSRILDLFHTGALSLAHLEQVVVDCSHIDQKKRGILDMHQIQQPLMALLNQPELKSRYGNGSGKVRLLLY